MTWERVSALSPKQWLLSAVDPMPDGADCWAGCNTRREAPINTAASKALCEPLERPVRRFESDAWLRRCSVKGMPAGVAVRRCACSLKGSLMRGCAGEA